MCCGGKIVSCFAVGVLAFGASGCVSMDQHRRLTANLRTVKAEKEVLAQELFDIRNGTGSLQARVDAMERELDAKDALVANLRGENELLDEVRRIAQADLEGMADKLGGITVSGPKLPPQLDNELKRFASEHPSEVSYDSNNGTVKWKSDLLFALGSDVVKQASMAALKGFTDIIKSPVASEFEVLVVGHTDNRPIKRAETKRKHPTNWHLATHRSISVANVLKRNGYAPGRIGLMGYGEFRPVANNSTKNGASQNRRVEMYLVPRGSIVRVSRGPSAETGDGRVATQKRGK